jgi:hypothetical protein
MFFITMLVLLLVVSLLSATTTAISTTDVNNEETNVFFLSNNEKFDGNNEDINMLSNAYKKRRNLFKCSKKCMKKKGNGICDRRCCISRACDYDGGDCTLACKPGGPGPCQASCDVSNIANHVCNLECCTAGCDYDGGDCTPDCKPASG